MEALQISAKDLGWLNASGFCERCFWIKRHNKKLPYQTPFAGIFSSIDSYTKSIVEEHFEREGKLPEWLGKAGKAKRLVTVTQSGFVAPKGRSILTGVPDQLFERQDGSYGIIDYKTARYTGTQDSLMPVYEVQLNGYAYIAETLGYSPVNSLYLVYFEPPVREQFREFARKHTTEGGFEMPFAPVLHRVKRDREMISRLIGMAERIFSSEAIPKGLEGCEDCRRLEKLIQLVTGSEGR